MQLTLSMLESSNIAGAASTYTLSDGSAVIGRARESDWYLPDTRRVLSKTHCRIEALDNEFTVTDLSTNGVFVNGTPVGYQQNHPLADGDQLRLGDVDIFVSIKTTPDSAVADEENAPFPPDGPFGNAPVVDQPNSADLTEVPATAPEDTQTLSPNDAIVVSLVQSFSGLDAAKLALAVDAAGAAIPETEWQAFYDRLRTFLQQRYTEARQ